MAESEIVSTEWLEHHLDAPSVRVVDCRGYVSTRAVAPGAEEADYLGARNEYLQGHIPGAVYIDWTRDIIDPDDPVPAQIASPDRFAEAMSVRGIDADTHVVAVDHLGGQFATRLWWALRYYGHDQVSVLEGGWNRWVEEDRPIAEGEVAVDRRGFVAKARPALRMTAEALRDRLGDASFQLLDARDAGQYTAARRRGPRGGHIPGAKHVPREHFLAPGGGFLPLDEVRNRFARDGVSLDKPVVAYCNGGVAATVVLFNLFRLGMKDACNYDGSWNEWGARMDLPVDGPRNA